VIVGEDYGKSPDKTNDINALFNFVKYLKDVRVRGIDVRLALSASVVGRASGDKG
jgi:hypothetical protein